MCNQSKLASLYTQRCVAAHCRGLLDAVRGSRTPQLSWGQQASASKHTAASDNNALQFELLEQNTDSSCKHLNLNVSHCAALSLQTQEHNELNGTLPYS